MKRYLLDTCVFSEFVKPRPKPTVLAWLDGTPDVQMLVSVLTIGELEKGICALPKGPKKERLSKWLETELLVRFAARVLPVTLAVARTWGRIDAQCRSRGNPLPVVDALIAATALSAGAHVVTRNIKHFENAGALVFDPWN